MYNYGSFLDFIQQNYEHILREFLSKVIISRQFKLSENKEEKNHKYKDLKITSIKVTSINYLKNRKDYVEFNVNFNAEYLIVINNKKNITQVKEYKKCLSTIMHGSFKKGFCIKQNAGKVSKIWGKAEKLSNSIVPIISKKELEIYAYKFLKEFCPEALTKPIKLNINRMLESKGIKVYYTSLENNAFGKIIFDNEFIDVYDTYHDSILLKKNTKKTIEVNSGTILINDSTILNYPISVYRNTMIHEIIHWMFHSNYFELKHLLVNKERNIEKENKDVAWMEWQAQSITPMVLMPKKPSLQKWNEIISNLRKNYQEINIRRNKLFEKALQLFADYFGVTLKTAKLRLIKLGVYKLKTNKNHLAINHIKRILYKRGLLKKNQTITITISQLAKLLISNTFLRMSLQKEKILYVNKMLIINNSKYVDNKIHILKKYALNHINECCLIFDIKTNDDNAVSNKKENYFLLNNHYDIVEQKEINMEHFAIVFANGIDSACHFEKHKKEMQTMSFGKTLQYHIDKSKSKGIIHNYEDLAVKSDVDVKKIRNYRYDEVKRKNINQLEIIRLGLVLKLSAPYIDDLLAKANVPICGNINGEISIFRAIIYAFQRQGLIAIYKELKKKHLEKILDVRDIWVQKFIKNNNFIGNKQSKF